MISSSGTYCSATWPVLLMDSVQRDTAPHGRVVLHQVVGETSGGWIVDETLLPPGEATEVGPAAAEEIGKRRLYPRRLRARRIAVRGTKLEDEERLGGGGGPKLWQRRIDQRA